MLYNSESTKLILLNKVISCNKYGYMFRLDIKPFQATVTFIVEKSRQIHSYTFIMVCNCDLCYVHTSIHTHTHNACIYIYCINTFIHTYTYTYVRTYTHTYTHTYIHTYIHTYVHTYIHTYVRAYINFNHKRSCWGWALAQPVNNRPITVVARVRYRISPVLIRGLQSGEGTSLYL
jgi:hypothetical protein